MKYYDVSIHFQTKTNGIELIEKKLNDWFDSDSYREQFDFSEKTEPRSVLHHCFLREEELKHLSIPAVKKEIIENTLTFLGMLSENQVRWKGSSLYGLVWDRNLMFENIKKTNGVSIFIGEIVYGVKDENDIAKELGCNIILIP